MTKELICISCPMGCNLTATLDDKGDVISVTGNLCKRGEVYAKKELTAPTRTITSTVLVKGGTRPLVSVRTASDIPKEKIMQCMEEIKKAVVTAPVFIHDIIIKNVADTGIAVIATSQSAKKEDKK